MYDERKKTPNTITHYRAENFERDGNEENILNVCIWCMCSIETFACVINCYGRVVRVRRNIYHVHENSRLLNAAQTTVEQINTKQNKRKYKS